MLQFSPAFAGPKLMYQILFAVKSHFLSYFFFLNYNLGVLIHFWFLRLSKLEYAARVSQACSVFLSIYFQNQIFFNSLMMSFFSMVFRNQPSYSKTYFSIFLLLSYFIRSLCPTRKGTDPIFIFNYLVDFYHNYY